MFKPSVQRLRFLPENGMHVLVRGRISLFERDGQYQLYVDDLQPDGLGALSLAFEQLKKRLDAEGLFDPARKKTPPRFPRRIGVVTSPTGAAIQDILSILGRRFPAAEVVFCPVQVQGPEAAPQIAAALYRFNAGYFADLLIVGRGGGSLEDLWAFNEEIVVRAVADSTIPVLSAVGHETDFTLCDFAADLRAPTPSAAAELAVPTTKEQLQFLSACLYEITVHFSSKISKEKAKILACSQSLFLIKNQLYVARKTIDSLFEKIRIAYQSQYERRQKNLLKTCARLEALSPLKTLLRGYAVVRRNTRLLLDTQGLVPGDSLEILMRGGQIFCRVESVRHEARL
jgi:exodeoxyribonuclease VII large subunit